MGGDGKLVRDRIPDIIRARGQLPVIRTAGTGEYRALLREKLAEETSEFLASADDPEELAEVLEVVRALACDLGVSPGALEQVRAAKAAERGGFAERLVWCGNLDLEPGQ
jgi:predicted house-cleaning noncanonical NTP pyrophosphatase (MazG superfamily)